MPIQTMKDIYLMDKNGNPKKVYVTLSARVFEDIGDFEQGDTVNLNVVSKVVKKDSPQLSAPIPASGVEGEAPELEITDYNERPDKLKPEMLVTIELVSGEITNLKEDRKRANNLELDKEELNEIQRNRGKSAVSDTA